MSLRLPMGVATKQIISVPPVDLRGQHVQPRLAALDRRNQHGVRLCALFPRDKLQFFWFQTVRVQGVEHFRRAVGAVNEREPAAESEALCRGGAQLFQRERQFPPAGR